MEMPRFALFGQGSAHRRTNSHYSVWTSPHVSQGSLRITQRNLSVDPETPPKYPIKAKSVLEPRGSGAPRRGARITRGIFYYTQHGPANTTITYEITGLDPHSSHGIHIHRTAEFRYNGCNSAGRTYNPYRYQHGASDGHIRHLGTLGNVIADASGVAKGSLNSKIIKLEGAFSVLHRSTMVHAYPDDFRDEESSGPRLACGEILAEEKTITE
ncbi:conserved hypothetical protein [Perkinsus marinus ATCC 50983]|uniref:Superoxide dismutase copper/zinc binding domain-containing protein n=1 Tax=Perkinsus marinus (strain ATCC 50983 / TXsc) TaxID=423536 RepID=C5KSD2_PERM5|nr:conserved hypothetical protein [Perkinsus marinus ATCC 50983]EER12622.1 conserved hypothetical protein [Perkinsus marinus ATCC 50983]|eukprot:XP_002780827.1 conserved hypothetical protein [Perkinsus marinus ATCC 50983]